MLLDFSKHVTYHYTVHKESYFMLSSNIDPNDLSCNFVGPHCDGSFRLWRLGRHDVDLYVYSNVS
jgi:hypothetical protein